MTTQARWDFKREQIFKCVVLAFAMTQFPTVEEAEEAMGWCEIPNDGAELTKRQRMAMLRWLADE